MPSLRFRSRDKLRSLQLMARKNIEMPITGFAHSPDNIDDLIKLVGGVPVVLKLMEGTQGIEVVLAETKKAAQSVIQAFMGLKANMIVQEYTQESNGSEIRCLIAGDKLIASIKRDADHGDFRSNLHRVGAATPVKVTKEEGFSTQVLIDPSKKPCKSRNMLKQKFLTCIVKF